MPVYTLKEIAKNWNVSTRTVSKRIKELKDDGKIKRNRRGFYTDEDVQLISQLIGLHWTPEQYIGSQAHQSASKRI